MYFRDNRVIFFDSYGMSPDKDKDYILPFIKRNSSGWIQNTEMLQDPWSKTSDMCIYINYQLNRGHGLKTAIHKELKGTGKDLSQNDRDIGMWFRTNYKRLIKKDTMCMTAPDILFKERRTPDRETRVRSSAGSVCCFLEQETFTPQKYW